MADKSRSTFNDLEVLNDLYVDGNFIANHVAKPFTATVGFAQADYIYDGGLNADIQINAAIIYVNSLGGGTVYIKQGLYRYSNSINLLSNVVLIGDGWSTIIQAAPGLAPNKHAIYVNGVSNTKIFNLKIDGNRTAQSTDLFALYVRNSSNFELAGCNITNCYSDGVHIRQGAAGHHFVHNNLINANGENGVISIATNDIIISDNFILGSGLIVTGGNNIMIGNAIDGTVTQNIIIANNHIDGATQNGIFLDVSANIQIVNNEITNNTFYGISSNTSNSHNNIVVGLNNFNGNVVGAMNTINGTQHSFIGNTGVDSVLSTASNFIVNGGDIRIDNARSFSLKDPGGLTGAKITTTGSDLNINQINAANILFGTSNLERMRLIASGKLGIGVTAPTAFLHLIAGSSAAGTAPLKLTSGINMSTPENGAFEFDGTNLYFTVGGSRKIVTLT